MSNLAIEAAFTGPRMLREQRFKRVLRRVERRVGEDRGTQRLSLSSAGHLYKREGSGDRQQASETTEERSLRVAPGQLVINPMWLTGGSIAVSDIEGAVSPDYRVFEPDREVLDARYLHHLVRSQPYRDQYNLFVRANTTFDRRIQQEDLDQLPLWLPSLDGQRRIADFLDDRVARIDQIITARRQQRVASDSLFQTRKESLLYSTPDAASLPLRRLRCLVQTGPFGSQLHSDEYVEDGWPVVNPACISRGRIHALRGMSVDEEVRARLARHVLSEGDIVFGRRGELGRAGLVTSSEVGWVCGTGSLLVRLFDDRARPAFIMNLLSTSRVRHYFQLQSVGSTMDNLNTDILLSVPLMLPALEQQDSILDAVEVLESESFRALQDVERSIDLLQEYKQSLITAAVTGEIDVTTAGSGIQG